MGLVQAGRVMILDTNRISKFFLQLSVPASSAGIEIRAETTLLLSSNSASS